MGVSRRYWGEAGLVVALVGLAVLLARPFLLVGAAGVAGWLLARQYHFVRTVERTAADLSVSNSLDRQVVRVEDEVRVVLHAELSEPAPVSLTVAVEPPAGVEPAGDVAADGDRRLTLAAGEQTATTSFAVRCPLAGAFEFDSPTVTATDATGRFRVAFPAGEVARLRVNPRRPRNLHVGAGGATIDAPYGAYASDERGVGIDLAEIRAYVPGDAVRQIDWNATARLDEPHVREFETTTERRTVLVLDRRASMAAGPPGETKFDYARQVALGVVAHAREKGEPVALYEAGAEGLLERHSPTATAQGYARLERRLRSLEPVSGDERRGRTGERRGTTDDRRDRTEAAEASAAGVTSPALARRRSLALRGDDDAFAARLAPFFADADPYVERVADDPLYGVVRTSLAELRGAVTAVVLTDDTATAETREVAKAASRQADRTLAFLTPTALFARDDEAARTTADRRAGQPRTDPETAYERYVDFEQFRRDLADVEGVSAFEVGPGDRLEALLAENESRRRRARTGERR